MNNMFGLHSTDIDEIKKILKEFPEVDEAVIFGSRAIGNYKQGSDVDITIKGKNINIKTVSSILFKLNEESLMPYHFDIINYNSISNQMLIEHIERVGILFYSKE